MDNEREKRILKELERTGYPLEVDVIDQFMEKGWAIFPEYTYCDPNTTKLRAIDLLALYSPAENLFSLMVECKSSKRPWIVHCTEIVKKPNLDEIKKIEYPTTGTNMLSVLASISLMNYLAPFGVLSRMKDGGSELLKEIQKLHFFTPSLPKAHSCHELGRKTDEEPDSFTRALYQIRGAYLDLTNRDAKALKFASIVHRGGLYEYAVSSSEPRLKHREHVVFQTLSLSSSFFPDSEKQGYQSPIVFVDIIEDSYLDDYLDLLKEDITVLRNIRRMLTGS